MCKAIATIAVLLLAGCALPTKPDVVYRTQRVEVPIPVPCKVAMPKLPAECQPSDQSRQAWLRCALIQRSEQQGYQAELEAALKACISGS